MNKKIAIVTCCLDDWGGSEELWARSVPYLLENGIKDITIFKNKINKKHAEFVWLKQNDVKLIELSPDNKLIKSVGVNLTDSLYRLAGKVGILTYQWNKPVHRLFNMLKSEKPDLVLISQGINFDGLAYANQCLQLRIPYLIVSHKAVGFFWPQPGDRAYMRETLQKAKKCLFVSQHNKKLTEEQFGIRLPNSQIVINPVKTKVASLPFPIVTNGYKLACIGRLFVIDKGQDMLIRVLAQPKWKNRAITVSFIGNGPDTEGLIELAKLLEVKSVSFLGFNQDLENIWADHHALILPSRSEGLPLTIVEAMSLGRLVLTTNVGGNNEIIKEGHTGFISEANEASIDSMLELSWSKKEQWEEMGKNASKHISKIIPDNPALDFARLLIEILDDQ